MTREDLQRFNTNNDAKQARELLQNMDAAFPNLPEKCSKRLSEMLVRRTNGGEYTEKDAEFLAALSKAQKEDDYSALCTGSNNTGMGVTIAWIFVGLTAAAVVVKNLFSQPRRKK